jgi:hypothetical protein
MRTTTNARRRGRGDVGASLAGLMMMLTALTGAAAVGYASMSPEATTTHHVVGEANVHLIEQAAEIDQIQNGADSHTALVTAAAACACAVEVDTSQDVLIYRSGDEVVSVDVAAGVEHTALAGGTDLPVDGPPNPAMTINVDH